VGQVRVHNRGGDDDGAPEQGMAVGVVQLADFATELEC
jgi:hypothetical protein